MPRMVEEYGNWFFVKPFNFVKPLKGFTLPTMVKLRAIRPA
jgi:hypothetical protein